MSMPRKTVTTDALSRPVAAPSPRPATPGRAIAAALIGAVSMLAAAGPAWSGDCTGYVVGVRPISQYDHAAGTGFLAVRSGPGGSFRQIGEVYRGDELSVWSRKGNWYEVYCMSGRCADDPLWGPPNPQGWVHKSYVDADGVCPR